MTTAPSSTAAANTTEAVLGGAVLAVGVLLAGVAVGRRSRFGVIAGLGMAALAGYAILKRSRQQTVAEAPPAPKPKPVEAERLAEAPAPAPAPAPTLGVTETVAPIAAPVSLEAPKQILDDTQPEAPLIWEAGDTGSRASDGLGETVWFGLQDVKLDAPAAPSNHEHEAASSSSQLKADPMGEVALEGDLAPLASVFLSDFPPAPEIETHAGAPAISPDVAALIQALNPPPLSPAMLNGPAFLLGSSAFAGEGSSSTEDYDDLSEAVGFLLEDEAPAKPLATIG
ncbi:MAG: hypothetical protein ACAI34_25595 [Verrucomicrobium sp.]